jgi:hypothetical protein
VNSSGVTASMRDLIVHLHRGNGPQAESIVKDVAAFLKTTMLSGTDDPASSSMQRAQQTMFALDEVRMLLEQRDFGGAAAAARDAQKEWKGPAPEATA